jgi:hypothetical protein
MSIQAATPSEAVIPVCSAFLRGLTENAIYCGNFGGKCHFMWLNHANNGAHYFSQVIDLIDFICGRNARFVARRQRRRV